METDKLVGTITIVQAGDNVGLDPGSSGVGDGK